MALGNPFLVSTEWLAAHLGDREVKIVDASWYLPDQNRNGRAEFVEGHTPGAVFFDIDAIADTTSNLPHMLPTEENFAKAVSLLGISDTDTIVIYDGAGLFSAPRVWWTFRVFGAQNVFILDGGLPAWKAEGRRLEQGVPHPVKAVFSARLQRDRVKTKADMLGLIEKGDIAIADARPQPRFEGIAAEPRPGLRGGHMPGARSVPSSLLVKDGRLLTRPEIEAVFKDRGLDLTGDVVTSCGSGVTAAILSLALETIGHKDHALYDGSWAEWGMPGETPVVLGAPAEPRQGVKPRYLKAHVTDLEMTSRPNRREPLPTGHKVALMKTNGMAASFYRYLYREVGKPHHWFVRRNLTDEQLNAAIGNRAGGNLGSLRRRVSGRLFRDQPCRHAQLCRDPVFRIDCAVSGQGIVKIHAV